MYKFLTIATLLIGISTGCRDEFVFTVPPERAFEYNLLSELAPHQIVAVQLLESVPIGSQLQNIDRRDAVATFSGPDVPGGTLDMAFNETSEKYHLVNEDFRVTEGREYEVMIIVPDEDMDTITATAAIPVSVDFAVDVLSVDRLPIDDRFSDHEVEVRITFEAPTTLPAYYRIIPRRLVSTVQINRDGNVIVTDGPETSPMEITEILTERNAVTRFVHQSGITLDESRMSRDNITLRLKSTEPLADGPDISSVDGIEALNRLHLEIMTVSQELIDYNEWVDDRLVNQGSNVPSAPREVPNIINASGVFGGFSRTIVTPRVRL